MQIAPDCGQVQVVDEICGCVIMDEILCRAGLVLYRR